MTGIATLRSRSRPLLIWLCIASVGAVLAVVPVGTIAAVSLMALGDEGSWVGAALFWTLFTLPIAVVMAPILAWGAYGLRWERLSLALSLSPLAWVVAIGLATIFLN